MYIPSVGGEVEGVVGRFDGLGLVAEVEGNGDGFVVISAGVGVGFGGLVEVDGLATAVPQNRMLAAEIYQPAIIFSQFLILIFAPEHGQAAFGHDVTVVLNHVPLLRQPDFRAVIDNGRASQGELAEGGQLQAALVAFDQPQEAIDIMVVEETGTAVGLWEKGFMHVEKGVKFAEGCLFKGEGVAESLLQDEIEIAIQPAPIAQLAEGCFDDFAKNPGVGAGGLDNGPELGPKIH